MIEIPFVVPELEAFRQWLHEEAQDPDRNFQHSAIGCPVARWLQETRSACPIEVHIGCILAGGLVVAPPEWVIDFVALYDYLHGWECGTSIEDTLAVLADLESRR